MAPAHGPRQPGSLLALTNRTRLWVLNSRCPQQQQQHGPCERQHQMRRHQYRRAASVVEHGGGGGGQRLQGKRHGRMCRLVRGPPVRAALPPTKPQHGCGVLTCSAAGRGGSRLSARRHTGEVQFGPRAGRRSRTTARRSPFSIKYSKKIIMQERDK